MGGSHRYVKEVGDRSYKHHRVQRHELGGMEQTTAKGGQVKSLCRKNQQREGQSHRTGHEETKRSCRAVQGANSEESLEYTAAEFISTEKPTIRHSWQQTKHNGGE
mgnify:CR=1 FL=1